MSLAPDWAPNIHPLVVHFPIALLIAAVVVDLISLLMHRRKGIRDAATWLYCTGAAAAIIAYFTGRNAADTMLLPAEVSPLVDKHSDWAFRTIWFFVFFASARLAVSYILKPRIPILVSTFVVALIGIGLLFETADHGGQLVFQHGLGVRAITTDAVSEEFVEASEAPIDPGLIDLDNGSWVWRPAQGADTVLTNQFTWLENDVSHVAPDIVSDAAKGPVLGLHPNGTPVLFVGGNAVGGIQADVHLNLNAFVGTVMLVHHVQDAQTFDFLSINGSVVKLGRLENGEGTVFEEHPLGDTAGWLELRVYGGDGHFRGYVNGELMTHGHARNLEPGPFGLRIDGTGTVLIERMQVQAVVE